MVIRVGIGGWTYEPWRGTFYPPGLKHAEELRFASRQLTAIEINGTFYRTQSATSFAKWRDETPDDFVFTVKGHRSVTNRTRLAEAGEAVGWFLDSGVLELGAKLGPFLWQLMPHKRFDPDDIAAFLGLLPPERGGIRLRHALEVRHASFMSAELVALASRAGVAIVYADEPDYPSIADPTADFVYARLQTATEDEPEGYPAAALDTWATRADGWARGEAAAGLPLLAAAPGSAGRRDVFVFMINGAKVRAPLAAAGLIRRLRARGDR